jgi:hypothetical protein
LGHSQFCCIQTSLSVQQLRSHQFCEYISGKGLLTVSSFRWALQSTSGRPFAFPTLLVQDSLLRWNSFRCFFTNSLGSTTARPLLIKSSQIILSTADDTLLYTRETDGSAPKLLGLNTPGDTAASLQLTATASLFPDCLQRLTS